MRATSSNITSLSKHAANVDNPTAAGVLLYTSGSTASPKEIQSCANVAHHLALKTQDLGLGREVVLQQSFVGFDISVRTGGIDILRPRQRRTPCDVCMYVCMYIRLTPGGGRREALPPLGLP